MQGTGYSWPPHLPNARWSRKRRSLR